MGIYSTVSDSLPHGFAVSDPTVICVSSIIAMVVLHMYSVRSRIALEALFSVDGRLGRAVLHVVNVFEIREMVDKNGCVPVALLGRNSLELRVESDLR